MSTLLLKVSGMSCGNCVKHVTHALQEINGVEQVDVDLGKGEVVVQGNLPADSSALINALAEEGYPAVVL
jgi:copper chaperone CopZ